MRLLYIISFYRNLLGELGYDKISDYHHLTVCTHMPIWVLKITTQVGRLFFPQNTERKKKMRLVETLN